MSALPPDDAARRAENLRAVLAGMTQPAKPALPAPVGSSETPAPAAGKSARGRWGVLGSLGAGAMLLLGKLNLLFPSWLLLIGIHFSHSDPFCYLCFY